MTEYAFIIYEAPAPNFSAAQLGGISMDIYKSIVLKSSGPELWSGKVKF